MNADEKMPTIRRDVAEVYKRLVKARTEIGATKRRVGWLEVDLAIARLEGLSLFIGPWGKVGLAEAER